MRKTLSLDQVDAAAMKAMASYHQNVVNEVQEAVRANRVCVVGMAQNPFVKKARRALTEKNLAFKYLEYGNYWSQWKQRLAIKLWSGWPTYPQVFVDGKLIGGFSELKTWLARN